ncbi:MAG: hypothetical protein ACYSVY_05245, partial [Planctomycetota bacterium]
MSNSDRGDTMHFAHGINIPPDVRWQMRDLFLNLVGSMTDKPPVLPMHYAAAIRSLLRFGLVMVVVGLLSGIAFQESSKKLSLTPPIGALSHLDAVLPLALVHGHILVIGVLFPVAMASALYLARTCGGLEVSRRALRWTVSIYLSFVSISVVLMLYKGYHVLLSARAEVTDMTQINGGLFAGSKVLRHGLYGLSHAGMGLALCMFVWCVWRSLR